MKMKLGNTTIASGQVVKDAEFKLVGSKNSPLCKISIVTNRTADGEKEYTNCTAWYELANATSGVKKGDFVFACGYTQDREYNGKTYQDLICDFISVTNSSDVKETKPETAEFEQIDDNSDLPF